MAKLLGLMMLAWASAAGAEGLKHPQAQAVVVNGTTESRLSQFELPELSTTVLCQANGLIVKEISSTLVISIGGTGAKKSLYGMAQTQSQTANYLIKRGSDFLAFENPIYWGASDSGAMADMGEKFGTARAQMDWFYQVLRWSFAQVDSAGQPKRVIVVGRSTGSAIIMQAANEYARGVGGSEILARVESMITTGIIGSTDMEVDLLDAQEQAHANLCDAVAQPLGAKIYRAMTYENGQISAQTLARAPMIYAIVGGRDEFVDPTRQFGIVNRFHQTNPAFGVHVIATDVLHNPTSSFTAHTDATKTTTKKVRTMKRFGPILDQIISSSAPGEHFSGARTVDVRPEFRILFPGCDDFLNKQ